MTRRMSFPAVSGCGVGVACGCGVDTVKSL